MLMLHTQLREYWAYVRRGIVCFVLIHHYLIIFLTFSYMHQFSGFISVPMVLALIYCSVSRLSRHQKATKGAKFRPRNSSLSFRGMCPDLLLGVACLFLFFSFFNTSVILIVYVAGKTIEDMNPIYTEQTIYESITPGLIGYLICLQGVEWVEMAFRMGWYYSGMNGRARI
jgi:hypothetical protein